MTSFALNSIVWCYFKDGLGKTKYSESSSCDSKYLEYLCKNPIYEFDMGIIDEKGKNGFHVTLGSGIQIYLTNDNILDEYCSVAELEDGQYFGRNTRKVRKYDKATNKWQPFVFNFLSDNAIFGNYLKQLREYDEQIKTVYRQTFFDYKISSLLALLPESFIYKLPLSPDTCDEPNNNDKQKYKTNSVVLIRPTMGYKHFEYEYEHVVAIILEYVPDINKYIVSIFEKDKIMLIGEHQIISHVKCPKDGDYFGYYINRAKRFSSTTETWEDVDDTQIENDETKVNKFINDKKIYVKLQSEQPELTTTAMTKYLRKDSEVLSYLKDLATEAGEIGLEKGIETTGSIFGSLGLDRLANVVGTAKSLAEPVRKLGYNLLNTSEEEIKKIDKRIAEREKQRMLEEQEKQTKLNKELEEKEEEEKEKERILEEREEERIMTNDMISKYDHYGHSSLIPPNKESLRQSQLKLAKLNKELEELNKKNGIWDGRNCIWAVKAILIIK
jgi:hypothetical protein